MNIWWLCSNPDPTTVTRFGVSHHWWEALPEALKAALLKTRKNGAFLRLTNTAVQRASVCVHQLSLMRKEEHYWRHIGRRCNKAVRRLKKGKRVGCRYELSWVHFWGKISSESRGPVRIPNNHYWFSSSFATVSSSLTWRGQRRFLEVAKLLSSNQINERTWNIGQCKAGYLPFVYSWSLSRSASNRWCPFFSCTYTLSSPVQRSQSYRHFPQRPITITPRLPIF